MDNRAGHCSPPQALSTPPGFPFYIALCGVTTRKGAISPEHLLARRFATGRGATQAKADLRAVAEAAERYSIQHSDRLPKRMQPFVTVGGRAEAMATAALTLGAPGRSNSSVGAAAGADLEDALRRAALEVLEHLHLTRLRSGADGLAALDPAGEPGIAPHVAWLAGQFRRLDIRARAFPPGYVVAVAACADLDGGRRTEGSAARPGRRRAVRAAVEEAIFHWRNMVEIERAGADPSGWPAEDLARIARYRGALPREDWPEAAGEVGDCGRADLEGLLAAVAVVSGQRVRAFDFTTPEVGVPVVKVVLG